MNRFFILSLLAVAVVCAGCIPSLHPIYTESDVVYDSALAGVWSEAESEVTWEFKAGPDNSYRLTIIDESQKEAKFEIHLVEIGTGRFLDIYPEDLDDEMNKFYQMHFFPVHTFMRVYQIEPTLRLAMLNGRWLDDYLAAKPDSCGHEFVNNEIILTASTDQLQAFLKENLDNEDAFETPTEFKKLYRD